MSMGASALAEALIDLGACEGLDPKNCAQATMKMVNMGEKGKPFAARIMGDEFETFKRQWRTAFERLVAEEREIEAVGEDTTGLWEDLGEEIE
jgi:hypothetical protein